MKTVVTAILALALLAPATASARSLTIRTGKYQVTRIGSYRTGYSAHYQATLRGAIRAFGRPSSRFHRYGGCIVKWRKLGLRIDFENFGTRDDTCRSDVGLPQSFSAMGSRWRSWKGLHVGMSEDRIEDFHPNADWHGRDDKPYGYWLRQAYTPIGDGGYYPVLNAVPSRHRVYRFEGWIGGAGE